MFPRTCLAPRQYLLKVKLKLDRRRNGILIGLLVLLVIYTLLLDLGYPYKEVQYDLPPDDWERDGTFDQHYGKGFCEIYPITSPYNPRFDCIDSRSKPKVAICLFEHWRDMYISHDIRATGLWEWHILRDIQALLKLDPGLGFIDVGANIGFYSLIAAKMGHKTVAVEPFLESVYRIHKAILLNNIKDNIVIVRNAIADIRMEGTVKASGDNQGDTRIIMDSRPCIGSCPPTINIILLNDLLEVTNFSRAIMKVDVQGFEHRAIVKSEKLLDTISIPYIFMEWLMMKEYYVSANHTSNDKYILEEMMQMLFSRNYRPFEVSYDGGEPLDPKNWYEWPHDIVWHKLPGAKEYGQLMRNHFMRWPS